jgi:asparagine synthase (glutamine-hydrolysing)
MCGLGFVLSKSKLDVNNILTKVNGAQSHRGPDGAGIYINQTKSNLTLGFSHTRLSIIDLSDAGHQPMLDEETGNVIVFNGEIYNFKEIAHELKILGETFKSSSDTEVLLKAYKHFTPVNFLRKLRGMFSFVLWDNQKQKALIVRDPCGIKPLYYTDNKDFFACTSESRAMLKAGLVNGSVDLEALDSFLSFGSVQAPLCLYKGVRSLLPGTMIWVDGDGKVSAPESYWEWTIDPKNGGVDAVSHHLSESMKRHLVADVPIGIFLSSGFDSYGLASLARKYSQNALHAFTMSFPDNPESCEFRGASLIASDIGIEHHNLKLTHYDFDREIDGFFSSLDQPSDDGLNVYLISKRAASEGVKTCIHGVGGDEIFGGYPSFRQLPMMSRISIIPEFLRKRLSTIIDGNTIHRSKMAHLLQTDNDLLSCFLVRRSIFSYSQRKALFGSEPPLGLIGAPQESVKFLRKQTESVTDPFSLISLMELLQYGSNKLLQDGDVMSMSSGLELRFPFLDVDLLNSVLSTSRKEKEDKTARYNKPLLLRSIPSMNSTLINRKKQGFTLPINKWILDKYHSDFHQSNSYLLSSIGLESSVVRKIIKTKVTSKNPSDWLRVWQLFVLQKWLAR